MATQLHDKPGHEYGDDWKPGEYDGQTQPAGNPSDPRGDYDPQKTPSGDSSDPRGDNLAGAESNPRNGPDSAARHEANGLADRVGKGFTSGGNDDNDNNDSPGFLAKAKNNVFKFTKKRALIGGTTLILGGGGIFGAFSILQGPAQLVQLAEFLKKPEFGTNKNTSIRLGQMYRYWRTGDIGETRVGKIGSTTFSRTMNQLRDVGIEFERDPLTGKPRSASVDIDKNTKYKGMSRGDVVRAIARDFDVPQNKIRRVGPKIFIDTRDFDVKATRALIGNSLSHLETGKPITALKTRTLAKFFNAPSLFTPLERIAANQENKYATKAERRQKEKERIAEKRKPVEGRFTQARASLKEKFSGKTGAGVGAFLITTQGMCLVRDSADAAAELNRGIAVMSALEATDKKAVGSQVQSGQVDMQVVGNLVESLKDENGDNIWMSKDLKSLGDPNNKKGVAMPDEYKQAFYPGSTAKEIKETLGGGVLGSAACSTVGQIVQGAAGVVLILTGPLTGGATWGITAARVGGGAAASAGAMYLLSQKLTDLLADKTVMPEPLAGPLGGSILAWGSVEAANIASRPYGAVPLNSTEVAALEQERYAQETQELRNKSFIARTFDMNNSRTPAGKLATTMPTDISSGARKVASGLTNLPSVVGGIFSSIFPAVTAQESGEDEFDFEDIPRAGIPAAVMNDPALEDPYENAAIAGSLFESSAGGDYIEKAKKCFGSNINKDDGVWTAAPETEVNPNSEEYVSANCGDTSDQNWRRTIMFVFDTSIALSAACFDGDAEACSEIGVNTTAVAQADSASQGGNLEANKDKFTDILKLPDGAVGPPEIAFYHQCQDDRWANKPYPYASGGSNTICASACGPTSIAMIVSTIGNEIVNPYDMSQKAKPYHVSGGTAMSGAIDLVDQYGLKSQKISPSADTLKQVLGDGGFVIFNANSSSPFTQAGHFVVIRGITEDGSKFYVADPADDNGNGQNRNQTAWPTSSLSGWLGPDGLYAVRKK